MSEKELAEIQPKRHVWKRTCQLTKEQFEKFKGIDIPKQNLVHENY